MTSVGSTTGGAEGVLLSFLLTGAGTPGSFKMGLVPVPLRSRGPLSLSIKEEDNYDNKSEV